MSRFLSAVAVLALSGLPTQAQDAVRLNYAPQFQEGATLRTEAEVKVDQILTLAGMQVETHSDTFMVSQETVSGPSSEGGWTFSGKFELVQSEIDLPGGVEAVFQFEQS